MTASETPRRPARARRIARWALLALAAALAGWTALVVHPQPLFAYTAREANVVLHARAPFPPETGPLLKEVLRRVSRSPLYDAGRVHHVFLCDTPALFGLLALWDYKVGGVTQTMLAGNVLIRPFDIGRGTVLGRSGEVKTGGRTLAYFLAHELTHAMTADRIGRWRYRRLTAFQTEGYADRVAFARPLDLRAERAALARGAPEMDPRRSGLYRRYELLVDYLFERRGFDAGRLLAAPLDRRAIEAELLADPGL
ncbi:MAG TPA: hypothetical protein VHO06_27435 [Polyangia bacterium]|nr:hypothetical protein [Polyangia bacterium]